MRARRALRWAPAAMGNSDLEERLLERAAMSQLAARIQSEGASRGALVTGATGLVGARLLPALLSRYAWVRTLSRSGRSANPAASVRSWDGVDPGPNAFDGVEAVIHLAGEPIFGGLPSAARLERIRTSRVDSTRGIVDRILDRDPSDRPATLICASAVGIYPDAGDDELAEEAEIGAGFLAEVCRDWESEASRATEGGLRVVQLRIGVVLAKEAGALALMKRPFLLGVGGRLGHGRQFFPWIHVDDLVRATLFCLEESIEGPTNAVAPEAIRNADLTRALGQVLSRPAIVPVPGFVIRALLREISGELLGSRRVIPKKLSAAGFGFDHATLRSALEAELG